jgi:hypothetical protein
MADKAEIPTALDLSNSASRLVELRKHIRPYWSPSEAGGIVLFTGQDDEDERFFRALASKVPQLAQIISEGERLAKLTRIIVSDVRAFLAAGKLAPGPYQLDNYHLEYARDGKLAFNTHGDPPIALPAERLFSFTVRDEHLKLLRHLNTREWNGIIELMDMKRPYGDMSYYFLDMAAALGEPPPRNADDKPEFTLQQIERYLQLHREMLFASQAFWRYAR